METEDGRSKKDPPLLTDVPISPQKRASNHAGKLALTVEFCERICYYSISGNLLLFSITMMGIGNIDSILIVLIFTGWSYCFSLVANWIADAYLGKYKVIVISLVLYSLGTALILTIAYFSDVKPRYRFVLFMVAVVFISFAAGTIKSNISSFGAAQVAEYGKQTIQRFFNCFYWLINIAAFISFTFIAYLQIENFFYGYIPALSTAVIAVLILLIGKNKFNVRKAMGSHLSEVIQITKHAFYRKWKYYKSIQSEIPEGTKLDLLEYGHVLFGGCYSTDQIDIVRSIGRVTSIFVTMIIYWAVYFQMPSVFLLQSQHFKLTINGFSIPAVSMNLFDSVSLFLLIQFMELCIYPLCTKFNCDITTLRRMGFGLVLTIISMAVAGVIENQRRNNVTGNTTNIIGNTTFNSSDHLVFWQAPQFILIGFSEVLTSISGLEFAYSQTPKALQGVVLSLFLASSGFGAFLACIIVKVVSSYTNWLCDDINNCKLEHYFYFLAGISLLNFLIFSAVTVNYSYSVTYSNYTTTAVEQENTRSPVSRGMTPNITEDWVESISSYVDLSRPVSPSSTISQ